MISEADGGVEAVARGMKHNPRWPKVVEQWQLEEPWSEALWARRHPKPAREVRG